MVLFGKLVLFLPLISALYVGLRTRSISITHANVASCSFLVLAAVSAWVLFFKLMGGTQAIDISLFSWISADDFMVKWSLKIDSLSALMLTLITTVSALVHIYSVGYMSHDAHPQRFMAYLSLFTFFMVVLVTANNLLQLFVGWEGVGLCSYLLIGFWYKRPTANKAAMKAFVVNRVGDLSLALGLFLIFHVFGTINYADIFANVTQYESHRMDFLFLENIRSLDLICVLLFIGCMGKSAQLGLHTWLPDAMEGPTPVSALIHAATMVTAGIFLVARMSPVFEMSEVALNMITIVGALTAIFAATIALTQNDIKKVIAYSTCSQLGYMFFACGVSAYAAGMFHLYTHGFFKALLFLSAGSVIHAMSDEQDMRKMGGIWRKIPLTYAMMIIGTLAITGFPFLSGYFSKDMVLEATYAAGHAGNGFAMVAFWLGLTAALFTAFYSWRLIFMTFHGKTRADSHVMEHIHESPKVMTIPLMILAIGAVSVGGIYASSLKIVSAESEFWGESLAGGELEVIGTHQPHCITTPCDEIVATTKKSIYEAAHHVPKWVVFSPLAVGIIGFVLAFVMYLKKPTLPHIIAQKFSPLYKLSLNKYYIDELYDFLFVRPIQKTGLFFWKIIDTIAIDGFGPNGFASHAVNIAKNIKSFQTGYIYHYSISMMMGLIVFLSWIFLYEYF